MIIIFLGVVGIAKLQHVAKSSNAQAIQRTLASNLADNFIERIRINPAGISTYFPTESSYLNGNISEPDKKCTSVNTCTPPELAAFDLWEWGRHLTGGFETVNGTSTGGLVNPVACLVRPAATGDGMYEIAIVWQGLTQLPNQGIPENANASLCGTTDGSYDAGSSNNNLYRRVHWQEIFLDV